ncbi:hypothetical protein TOPH_06063, partial [Tolypocladium ophioglossoides CBS 100239]
ASANQHHLSSLRRYRIRSSAHKALPIRKNPHQKVRDDIPPPFYNLPTVNPFTLHHFAESPRSSREGHPLHQQTCRTRSPRRITARPPRPTRSASPSPPRRSASSRRSAPRSSSAPRARTCASRAPSACPPRPSRSPPARPLAVRVPRPGTATRCASTSVSSTSTPRPRSSSRSSSTSRPVSRSRSPLLLRWCRRWMPRRGPAPRRGGVEKMLGSDSQYNWVRCY